MKCSLFYTGQFPLDIMHDFLEKVGSYDAYTILTALIHQGYFTIEQYNAALSDILFEGYERSDRPPPLKARSDHLVGKALTNALHIRVMPLILVHLGISETESNSLLDLLFMLHKLNEYIQADVLSKADPEKFEELLVNYFAQRKMCIEQGTTFRNMVPKDHFMEHQANEMRKFGPMNGYWTARAEGKHRTFVNFSESAKTWRNITKTLARKNQNLFASRYECLYRIVSV
jgi:hypothetical protein